MKQSVLILILKLVVVIGLFFSSCKKDKEEPAGEFEGGIYISNEGTLGKGNGSISYYDTNLDTIYNEVFYGVNQRYLGEVVNSIAIYDKRAYICAFRSGKIEVADLNFNSTGTIENTSEVRYFIGAGGKGYATSWAGVGQVKVIDLGSNTVTNTILLNRKGPERMLIEGEKLYVANSGGTGVDSTISVIETSTDKLAKTIYLDAYNPTGMVKDYVGYIWVLCKGKEFKHGGATASKLIKINPFLDEVEASVVLFDDDQHPEHLTISSDEQTLYYGGGLDFNGVYKIDVTTLSVPTSPLIDAKFYSIGLNNTNGQLFGLQSPCFSCQGKLHIFNSDGSLAKMFVVGAVPGNVSY